MTSNIFNVDIVRSGLDGDTVVTTLVDKILQPDAVHVHGICTHQQRSNSRPWNARLTETIRVLHPILPKWSVHSRRIAVDAAEVHIGAIHDVQGPQLRVFHVEVLDRNIAYIPKDEGHGSPRLGEVLLHVIPGISIAIDAAGTISIDPNPITSYNKPGMVILESYRIGVTAPVC